MSRVKQWIKKLLMIVSPFYRKMTYIENQLTNLNVLAESHLTNLNTMLSVVNSRMTNYQSRNQNLLWLLQEPRVKTLNEKQRDFWREYPKAQGDMKIIQQCNLWMMKELKAICDAHGLLFWLHGGTLIGGVRHQGFIPWDDDVDVGMTRQDLEKLIDIIKHNEIFQIFQYYHDNHTFSRAYQFKIRDESIPNFVDIFVFDYCECETSFERRDFLQFFREMRRDMVESFLSLENPPQVEDVGYNHFGPLSEDNQIIADNIIDEYLDRLGDYRKGNCIYYSIENYPFPYPVMSVEEVFPMQKLLFEGEYFDAPQNIDLYLDGYNDYWQPPADIGKRTSHYYWYEPRIDEIAAFMQNVEKNKCTEWKPIGLSN